MKREPGIALKDALRFWESEDGHTDTFDPQEWAARLQEWAARFLADRGLPAAKDRGGFHRDANTGEEIIFRGRKVPIPDTDESALHSVEARFDLNSGECWAARIKRLGESEALRLVAHLSASEAAAAERVCARLQKVEAGKKKGGTGFKGAVLPEALERAYQHNPAWRSRNTAALARYIRRQETDARDERIRQGLPPGPKIPKPPAKKGRADAIATMIWQLREAAKP